MKKEYMLIGVGGMNSECMWFDGRYDNLDEVFKLELLDVDGDKFKDEYKEEYWEGYYGDMNDGMDEFIDRDKESVNRVYGINEGLEMFELNVFGA